MYCFYIYIYHIFKYLVFTIGKIYITTNQTRTALNAWLFLSSWTGSAVSDGGRLHFRLHSSCRQ